MKMDEKQCTKCRLPKSLDDFYKAVRNADGFETACKTCYIERVQDRRAKKIEEVRAYDRQKQQRYYAERRYR